MRMAAGGVRVLSETAGTWDARDCAQGAEHSHDANRGEVADVRGDGGQAWKVRTTRKEVSTSI